jgi:hypothetical protein
MVALHGRDAPKMLLERAKIAEEYGDTPGQGMAGDRGHRSAVYRKPLMAIIEPSPMSLPRLRSAGMPVPREAIRMTG